jgi:formylglycine-generating enzyme required for sulfatase activity
MMRRSCLSLIASCIFLASVGCDGQTIETAKRTSADTSGSGDTGGSETDAGEDGALDTLGAACTLNAECASGFCATGPTGTADDRCAPTSMNYIPAGTFIMGSPVGEVGQGTNETQHSVTLSRSFFLGQTEVTQGQWKALSGGINPSCFQSTTGTVCTTSNTNDSGPVERLDWYAAVAFANVRSAAEGLTSCYTLTDCDDPTGGWQDGVHRGCTDATFVGLTCTGYRLPTESEWEYAARGGTSTATYLGNLTGSVTDCTTAQANLDGIAWWCLNSGSRTQAVGGKSANSFGLSDMLSNVYEWTGDWYGAFYPGTVTDPTGNTTGSSRVYRGGSWDGSARRARAAFRGHDTAVPRYYSIGFRLARTAP